jgi:hypothetical protein
VRLDGLFCSAPGCGWGTLRQGLADGLGGIGGGSDVWLAGEAGGGRWSLAPYGVLGIFAVVWWVWLAFRVTAGEWGHCGDSAVGGVERAAVLLGRAVSSREIRATISRAINASPSLRNKKDLVEDFVDSISATGDLDEEWAAYIARCRAKQLKAIIGDDNLKPEETRALIDTAFRDGEIKTAGTAITKVPPPVSRFAANGGNGEKKQRRAHQSQSFLRAVLRHPFRAGPGAVMGRSLTRFRGCV